MANRTAPSQPYLPNLGTTVLVDPGIVPMVFHEPGMVAAWRIVLVVRASDSQGSGYIPFDTLADQMAFYGVVVSRKTILRWLQTAIDTGLLWREGKRGERLHYAAEYAPSTRTAPIFERLAERLIEAGKMDVAEASLPAKRKVSIDVSGSVSDFKARLYAAWIGNGENSSRYWQRSTLKRLFNTSRPTLIEYEQRTGVQVQTNHHQTANQTIGARWIIDYIDRVGRPTWTYIDMHGRLIYAQQTANTYRFMNCEHSTRGRQRKTRMAALHYLERVARQREPVVLCADGLHPLSPAVRVLFRDTEPYKAYETANRHVRRHSDALRTRKVFLGQRKSGSGVMEIYDPRAGIQTTSVHANSAITIAGECEPRIGGQPIGRPPQKQSDSTRQTRRTAETESLCINALESTVSTTAAASRQSPTADWLKGPLQIDQIIAGARYAAPQKRDHKRLVSGTREVIRRLSHLLGIDRDAWTDWLGNSAARAYWIQDNLYRYVDRREEVFVPPPWATLEAGEL